MSRSDVVMFVICAVIHFKVSCQCQTSSFGSRSKSFIYTGRFSVMCYWCGLPRYLLSHLLTCSHLWQVTGLRCIYRCVALVSERVSVSDHCMSSCCKLLSFYTSKWHGTDSRWNCGPRRFPLTYSQKNSKLICLAVCTSDDFCLLGAI